MRKSFLMAVPALVALFLPCCANTTRVPSRAANSAMVLDIVEDAGKDGRASRIIDGDTLLMRIEKDTVKVRIEGIDPPEKGQPFGTASKEALAALVAGKALDVAPLNKDRYGRTLAHIYTGSADVGLELIHQGLAWHYV